MASRILQGAISGSHCGIRNVQVGVNILSLALEIFLIGIRNVFSGIRNAQFRH